jgi:hypothetical protein
MKTMHPERGLERLLIALERDLLDATDDEVLAAAKELGMNPAMKGSAAFFGVTLLVRMRTLSEKTTHGKGASVARRRPKGDAPRSS